ncbi:MAG: MBL fold metallo-hydrolase, partial [Spirochaetales bacterium]
MNEILPDIFVVSERGAFGAVKPEINVYVLAGHDGLIFDAGYGSRGAVRHLVREVRAIGERFKMQGGPFSVRRILTSHAHPDHFSGLRPLREELGLRV